jgi:hypothetical protein
MSDLGGELDALASGTGFSGVVRIDQGDRIELARAYGLAHRGFEIPNAVDTRFGLASGVKGFTALAVVSLIEEGVLTLSTPARAVLGSDLPAIDDGVTVEHLLSHRSGIGDYLDEKPDSRSRSTSCRYRSRGRVEEQRLASPSARQRGRRDLLDGRRHELVLAGVLRRTDRRHGLGLADGSAAKRRAGALETLRAGLLAPPVERRRPPGGVRRGRLVPDRARSARKRDAHGDLEYERWRVADRSVSRDCASS